MNILAFFTSSGSPATGLSPTIRIRNVSTGALVVTDASMTEVGDGFYRYNYAAYDPQIDYAIRCDGTAALPEAERYVYGSNQLAEEVDNVYTATQSISADIDNIPTAAETADAVWDEPRTDHLTAGTFGRSAQIAHDGQAQAGALRSITLANTASSVNNYYIDDIVLITSGTGAGQARRIKSYAGGTRIATIQTAWGTNPNNTSNYIILPGGKTAAVDSPQTAIVTTIATLTSQTQFTLTEGAPDDNAYNDFRCVISDSANPYQVCLGYIRNYIGSTRTVYLREDPGIFTYGVGDQVLIILDATNEESIAEAVWLELTSTYTTSAGTMGQALGNIETSSQNITAGQVTIINQLSNLNTKTDSITASIALLPTALEISDAVWDELIADHTTAGTFGAELATKADLFASAQTTETAPITGFIVAGTNDSGDWTDVYTRDSVYWVIGEDATNGLNVEFRFNLPGADYRPGLFRVFGRYIGTPSTTHFMDLWAYNYESMTFEQLVIPFMPGGNTSDSIYEHEYYERNVDRDNNNEVRIRIRHNITAPYNAAHDLFLDFVEITSILPITAEDIADAVWTKTLSGGQTAEYYLYYNNEYLKRVLGLIHENIYIDNPSYDVNSNLVSARVRIYSDAASVGTTNNVIGTYQITADTTGQGPGKFNSWRQIKTG